MDKNELIKTNIEFARTLAKTKKKKTDNSVYYEELEAAAFRGLVDAANNYDGRIPFKKYAGIRIIGEMNDYLRELRWGKVKVVSLEEDIPKQVEDKLEIETLFRCVPSKARQAMYWYYWDGMTMKQIGNKLGLTESSVSKLINKHKNELSFRKEEILAKMGVI